MALALDAMGGDLAPAATVGGALRADRERGPEVTLVADDARLRAELRRLGAGPEVYARRVLAVARPSIGIVAEGEEEEKGTDLARAAASALRKPGTGVHFKGTPKGRTRFQARWT